MSGLREAHIQDSVEELSCSCFAECKCLSHVTFGGSSLLKVVGKRKEWKTSQDRSGLVHSLREIHIPDRIEKVIRNAVPRHVRITLPLSQH